LYASEIKTERRFKLDNVTLQELTLLASALSEWYPNAPASYKDDVNRLWTQLDDLRQEALEA
jgi:hypothetical protein